MNCIQPYNDDYMVFDTISNQYVLTEAALKSRGFDLRNEVITGDFVNPEAVIQGFFMFVSDTVYAYLHNFAADTTRQNFLIATVPSLRNIILRAMLWQAIHMYKNGDGWLSDDKNVQDTAIDKRCISILNENVPELGQSILYCGV